MPRPPYHAQALCGGEGGGWGTKINEFSYPNGVKETRYYLFQNIYVNDLEDINSKQVYATTETGNFMGYAVKHKSKFYLHNFYGDRIDIAGEVLKASKIEWTRQV